MDNPNGTGITNGMEYRGVEYSVVQRVERGTVEMVAVIRHKHEKIRSGYQQSSGSNRGRERDRQSACAQETAACTAPQCLGRGHLLAEPSTFADPDAAARKLVQIANAVEAVQDGRM
jgi:hypothetical protein